MADQLWYARQPLGILATCQDYPVGQNQLNNTSRRFKRKVFDKSFLVEDANCSCPSKGSDSAGQPLPLTGHCFDISHTSRFGSGGLAFMIKWGFLLRALGQDILFISLRLMPPAFAGLEIASSMARSTTKSSSSNNSTILSIASSMARSTTKSNSNSSNNQQQQ